MVLGNHLLDPNNTRGYPFIHMGGVEQFKVNFLLGEISGDQTKVPTTDPVTRSSMF